MSAQELFQAGKLDDAIAAQIQEVKAHPADHARRLLLYELCLFAGDLDRARRQIEAIRYDDDPERDAAVATYRKLLDSEQARRRLFSDGLAPSFLADPPAHLKRRLDAVNRLREGRPAEAAETLSRANAEAASVSGQLNGRAFASLRDADDLFAHVLEVMADGQYFWVALEQVVIVAMNPPRFPRDLIYIPARLEASGAAGDVFLPALYPGTHASDDPQIRLGRATDWTGEEGGPVLGIGRHTFLVDEDDLSILEWRELRLDGPEPSGGS
jgi:type VI secretion system protein ImpE